MREIKFTAPKLLTEGFYGHVKPQDSPDFLRFLFESSNDAIVINDLQGNVTGWNKAAEDLYGYTAEEITGKHVSVFAPKGKKTQVQKIFEKLKEGEKVQSLETERIRKDGSIIFVSLTLSPIKDSLGKTIAFSAIVRDITNREKTIQALSESEKKYRHLIELANDAIFIAEVESGIIIDANKKAEDLIGKSIKEIIGMHHLKLHPPQYSKKYGMIFKKQVKQKHGVAESIYVINKNGIYIPVEISASVIRERGKTLILGIFRDITERKRIEELKKEFLSLAAHELKTPITTLKLISQAHIAKFKRYGSDQIKLNELKLIDRELERLTQLINDLLDDTRVESGKLFMKFEVTNLKKLLVTIIKKISMISKKHKIILLKLPEKISVLVDQQRIEQVLVNLLSNAIKYSNPGTKIEIGTTIKKNKVMVWVKDEGLGIPKSQQKLIFDRFYQVKSKEAKGFGLGLYITKQIIDQHKGKIWVESIERQGSTFYFTLPDIKI